MKIEHNELEELKQIYFRHYHVNLNDQQALSLGTRLINLFQIIARKLPELDSLIDRPNIEVSK